jgi:hypothetical protein
LKVTPSSSDATRPLSCKLSRIKRCLEDTEKSQSSLDGGRVETPLLEQHREKVGDMKKELSILYEEIIALNLSDDHDLVASHASLKALQLSVPITSRSYSTISPPAPSVLSPTVRVPPSFPN